MGRNPVLSKTLLKIMALVALAPLLFSGLFWAVGEYRSAQLEAEDLRKRFIQHNRKILENEVGSVINYIKLARKRLEKQSQNQLIDRVNYALQVAGGIYRQNRDQKSPEEIKKLIRDALRTVRFDGGMGYFFAVSLDGKVQLYPARPGIEGRIPLEVQDGAGSPITREVVELARTKRKGFYRYFWKKKRSSKEFFPKISYVKVFEPYGWAFGTGKYLDDMQAEIQARIMSNVAEMRFGTEGYYFACDYKGNPLLSNGKITKGGKNIWDTTDPDGVKVIQRQVEAAKKPGGGFYYYSWPKLNEPGPFPKMSFVKGLPKWQWAVGAGVYLDTIEKEIGTRERSLWYRLASRAVEGFLVMILFLTLTYFWADRIAKRIKQSLETFSGFFMKAGNRSARIDLERVHYQEFKDMARWANQMVEDRNRQEKEKELLEAQLRQSQKMEAIGTLAGGIAHDFNNILAAIVGYAELTLEDCRYGQVNPKFMENILEASMRAKELVRGILTFSRSDEAPFYTLDLNREVRLSAEILERTLPKMVRLEQKLATDLGPILGDSGQIQQVLLNLASNSSDAMPDGGTITLATEAMEAEKANFPPDKKVQPKAYAVLRVTDTGLGIPEEIQEQVFDPFFTTKEVGKGTGLGLSTVYGIVRGHNGHIECHSEPGMGTEFAVYFPVTTRFLPPPLEKGPEMLPPPGGGETLLVVDDEKAMREIGVSLLGAAGYRTLSAASGEEALELYQKEDVDLVVLDLEMPGMGGRECIRRLWDLDPGAKVVVASGHAAELGGDLREVRAVKAFVAKPYRKEVLQHEVRKALDEELE